MHQPRVLVVTSCTREKRFKPENQLKLEDFKDADRFQSRESELQEFVCSASQMYTGVQHLRTMEGVQLLRQYAGREVVDVAILSAGYGLIPEDKTIVPYEVTFSTMKRYEVDEWAKFLRVHQVFEQAIVDYDLVFVLLGENYLRSLLLPVETRSTQTLIFLASYLSSSYIPDLAAKTYTLPLSNVEAKRYRYGLVGLKGFLFKKFAQCAALKFALLQEVYSEPEIFVQVIDTEPVQLELPLVIPKIQLSPKSTKKLKIGRSEDKDLIPMPDIEPALNLHLGMQYFIPEWDDRVDPGYDFLRDTQTPGRNPYEDELYAHQIYPNHNYDGILFSKGIVESSKKKKHVLKK